MFNAQFNQFCKVFLLTAEAAGDKSSTRSQSEGNWIQRCFNVAERHTLRFHSQAAGWRSLTGGEAIDLIVHHDVQQIHIPTHRVHEMIATDSEPIAVTAGHNHG